jgi:hypothetical protein
MFTHLKGLMIRTAAAVPADSAGAAESRVGTSEVALPQAAEKDLSVGINLDQRLVETYFRQKYGSEAVPLATDSFLKKSKAEYCQRWCVRELVQNFADANIHFPATINGVDLEQLDLAAGKQQTLITGNWQFRDYTGLTALHSEKASETSAGGNAIGLKQVVIRMLRDFQVSEFEIGGDGWTLNYHLLDRNEANHFLAGLGVREQVQHNWLVAEIKSAPSSEVCYYRIVSEDKSLHQALGEFYEVGVCDQNSFLQNAHFTSEKGQIVWGELGDRRSRLYMNGQVFAYSFKGDSESSDYWNGPGYVTLRLNNVKYNMSVDRPPLTPFALDTYSRDLLTGMSIPELVQQLHASKHLWTNFRAFDDLDYQNKPYCLRLVQKIVDELGSKVRFGQNGTTTYNPDSDFENEFGANLLADHSSLTSTQRQDLQEKGYILCPEFFQKIGMPTALGLLEGHELLAMNRPRNPSSALRLVAEEQGLPVATTKFKDTSLASVCSWLVSQEESKAIEIERSAETQVRLVFPYISVTDALLRHPIYSPKSTEQKIVHGIRSFVFAGLKAQWLESAHAIIGSHVVTFKKDWDLVAEEEHLLIRLSKCSESRQCVLILDTDAANCDELVRSFDRAKAPNLSVPTIEVPQLDGDVQAKLAEIEIDHGTSALEAQEIEVVPGAEVLGAKERNAERAAILAQVDQQVEATTTEALARVAVEESSDSAFTKQVFEQYLLGRENGGVLSALPDSGYLQGATISDLLTQFSSARIAVIDEAESENPGEAPDGSNIRRLSTVLKALAPEDTCIDHFQIILEPSSRQLLCLHVLREYAALACGVRVPNDLFVYSGTGSKGINVGRKAIGIHEELCQVAFEEAYSTFVHEIAHNYSMKHDNAFIFALQTLLAKSEANLFALAKKQQGATELSEIELRLLAIRDEWPSRN